MTPLTVWLLAFLIWLFWHDIVGPPAQDKTPGRSGAGLIRDEDPGKSREGPSGKRPREDIRDEDRKKLDDILQRR
jgi:hypothetical protein